MGEAVYGDAEDPTSAVMMDVPMRKLEAWPVTQLNDQRMAYCVCSRWQTQRESLLHIPDRIMLRARGSPVSEVRGEPSGIGSPKEDAVSGKAASQPAGHFPV
jgi:hypothetical protein